MFSIALAALCFVSSPAEAADMLGRTLNGEQVAAAPEIGPRALVFFSMSDAKGLAQVSELQDVGLDVVLVSRDAASVQSELRGFLARHGVRAPVVSDASGEVARRYGVMASAGVVLVSDSGSVIARSVGARASTEALARAVTPDALLAAVAAGK